MGSSSRAAEADSGRLYDVSRPDGADERAAREAASGAAGPGHQHVTGPADKLRVPPVVGQVLASGGTPLDATTRGAMEPRLGHDLADVRIHAGPDAALAAQSVQARAFTAGSHVVLGATAPAAASPAGARLLAHELTHVVQQAHGGYRLQRAGLDEDLQGGEPSASGHPILDQMQLPPFLLVDADALERAMDEALAADPSTRLPAPSPGDTDQGFAASGPGSSGYALSFEYQPRPGGEGRLDLLARTYVWTLTGAGQTLKVELTYPGSGRRAVRQVTVVNQLDGSGGNTIEVSYDIELDVPPEAETLTTHPSLAEVLGAPAASQKPQVAHVPAAAPAPGQPREPAPQATAGPAPQDDGSWWQEFVTQLRGAVGDGLGHALGQTEGVALEVTGMAVDPVLWAASPEAKRAAVDSFLNILPVPVPSPLRTAVEEAVALSDTAVAASAPAGLSLLKSALTAAGYTDPYTGAPALSPAVTALGDAIDKDVLQLLFGPPDQGTMLTPRDVGQLEGALGTQVVLAFTGVEEVEVALKVLGALGMIKNITDVMARDDAQGKPWLTDPDFLAVLAGAVLYVVGLGFSSANKKLAGAITEWAGAAISSCPGAAQLSRDWAAPPSASRDEAIKDDILALIRQLAIMLLPILAMARSRTAGEASPKQREGPEGTKQLEGPEGTTRPVRQPLTDEDQADALALRERTTRTLNKKWPRGSPRPRDFGDVIEDDLKPAVAQTVDPAVRAAAMELLGDGGDSGLLHLAADALRNPDNYAQVLYDLDRMRLAIRQPKTIEGYTAAAVELARDRGEVFEIHVPEDKSAVLIRPAGSDVPGEALGGATDPQTGFVDPDVFMERLSGQRFVDNAIGQGPHGSLTHLIHYFVLDNRFRRIGMTADQFYAQVNLVSRELNLSDKLWVALQDPLNVEVGETMVQPETIWPILSQLLETPSPSGR